MGKSARAVPKRPALYAFSSAFQSFFVNLSTKNTLELVKIWKLGRIRRIGSRPEVEVIERDPAPSNDMVSQN